MDVAIINPFLEATLDVTRTMALLDITVGKPKVKKGSLSNGVVTGLISLHSSNHNGSLSISFDEEVLYVIYRNMLGEEHTREIDEQILDLAGELTNMVCGGAKQRLAKKGYHFDLTQPEILNGKDHQIHHLDGIPVIQLPLTTHHRHIYLEVCLR